MSYDIQLVIDTGGEHLHALTECMEPIFNLGPMFCEALCCGISDLRGKLAGDTIARLDHAVADMRRRPDHFKKFDSPNGWGRYAIALETLGWMAEQARLHPKATWRI